MGPVKHHPDLYLSPPSCRWVMHVSLASEPCRGGVRGGDAVSTDQAANTVSANTVIVALQLHTKPGFRQEGDPRDGWRLIDPHTHTHMAVGLFFT